MRMHLVSTLAVPIVAALSSGCLSVGPESESNAGPAPTLLKEVNAPAGFLFDSTQPASIRVKANPTRIPQGEQLPLEVRNAKDQLLVQAKLDDKGTFRLELPLPLSENELIFTLGDQTRRVTLGEGNVFEVTFD